jgi:hypothetical protein
MRIGCETHALEREAANAAFEAAAARAASGMPRLFARGEGPSERRALATPGRGGGWRPGARSRR